MESFHCWFTIRLEAKDGAAVLALGGDFCRMPFVPQRGLKMVFGEDEDVAELEIADVAWRFPQGCFWVTLKTDSSLMNNNDCPCKPDGNCCVLDTHLPQWVAGGWEVTERWKWADVEAAARFSGTQPPG